MAAVRPARPEIVSVLRRLVDESSIQTVARDTGLSATTVTRAAGGFPVTVGTEILLMTILEKRGLLGNSETGDPTSQNSEEELPGAPDFDEDLLEDPTPFTSLPEPI